MIWEKSQSSGNPAQSSAMEKRLGSTMGATAAGNVAELNERRDGELMLHVKVVVHHVGDAVILVDGVGPNGGRGCARPNMDWFRVKSTLESAME